MNRLQNILRYIKEICHIHENHDCDYVLALPLAVDCPSDMFFVYLNISECSSTLHAGENSLIHMYCCMQWSKVEHANRLQN